jgi:hypothetical protein
MIKTQQKLIHDMNSGLGSLVQAMELLADKNIRSDDLVDKIAPLSLLKIQSLIDIWEQLRPKLD